MNLRQALNQFCIVVICNSLPAGCSDETAYNINEEEASGEASSNAEAPVANSQGGQSGGERGNRGSGKNRTENKTSGAKTANRPPKIVSDPIMTHTLYDTVANHTLRATIRDFKDSHVDFETFNTGLKTGMVAAQLDADEKPVYIGSANEIASGQASFSQWYRDVEGINLSMILDIPLVPDANGVLQYTNTDFFPIDDVLFGNQGRVHNYHFTLETKTVFTYRGGERFAFQGDDDVYVFIDGKLVVDIGGVHGVKYGSVDLDDLDLTVGQSYSFHFFFAERHTTKSNFKITTSIRLGEHYTYDVNAADPDGDTLTYTLLSGPTEMKMDAKTGLLNWSPGVDQAGDYNVRVMVSDGKGGTDTQEYILTVTGR